MLFDNKKCFKNRCFDVRDLEKTISHDIFIQIGSGIIFFSWISTEFKQFFTFSFFFSVCAFPQGPFFLPKITFQREKHYFFQGFIIFLSIFAHFPPLPPPNPCELRPCTYETEAAYHFCLEPTRIRWGYIIGPNKIETPIYVYI